MKKGKYIVSTLAALLLVSSGSVSFAAGKGPVIYYNNDKVTTDKTPIIQDGTTYVPLRLLATMFGKDVSFDSQTYHININDKPATPATTDTSSATQTMQQQIADLQTQIEQLKSLIATTQAQVQTQSQMPVFTNPGQTPVSQTPEASTPVISLIDLQGILNGSDYLRLRSFQINDIYLSGDSSNLTLEMDADLKAEGNNEHWTDLTVDDIRSYISTLSAKIRTSYPNAKISGTIKNTSYIALSDTSDVTTNTQYLASFTVSSDGTVSVDRIYE